MEPDEFVQLIAHPLRWRLLDELGKSDRKVNELCELTCEPQNLVSYHLRKLLNGGLVSHRRSSFDARDVYYQRDFPVFTEQWFRAGEVMLPGLRHAHGGSHVTSGSHSQKPRVLFLCTGNSARSQMAEALIAQQSLGAISALSGGSHPKPLHPYAVKAMARRGIDISGKHTKHFDQFSGIKFEQVVTLCDKVREVCPRFLGKPSYAHWSLADPAEGVGSKDRYSAFERTAQLLEIRIGVQIAELSAKRN